MSDCLFCKIVNRDIPAELVYEDDNIIAFNDINPQAPVHILFIPKIHIASTEFIDDSNFDITGKIVLAASKTARKMNLEGYRLVMNCNEIAGQSVFHIHCHMLAGRPMLWPPG
ncbi:MAG TPA: histidine triad nucleotide-binding protein [Ignavibacteria bacterium]|nr:histidine triad nucleotide-binding protein [Ignavibacteria bacterium]